MDVISTCLPTEADLRPQFNFFILRNVRNKLHSNPSEREREKKKPSKHLHFKMLKARVQPTLKPFLWKAYNQISMDQLTLYLWYFYAQNAAWMPFYVDECNIENEDVLGHFNVFFRLICTGFFQRFCYEIAWPLIFFFVSFQCWLVFPQLLNLNWIFWLK